MKINEIEIHGMHNADYKKFDVNEDVTYLYGPNGVGKSTILEAIELAILGYIPGGPKTNQAIMKHANSSNMSVSVSFDNDTKITRNYTAKGDSASSSTVCEPEDLDLTSILQDLELPVFNFSQFLGMSANEQKKWFLDFLPSSLVDVDWKSDMVSIYHDTKCNERDEYVDKLIEEFSYYMDEDVPYIDRFKTLNSKIKEYISYEKGNLAALKNTLNSLTYYSDIDSNVGSLEDIEKSISDTKANIKNIESKLDAIVRTSEYEYKLKMYSDLKNDINDDMEYSKLSKEQKEFSSKITELTDYMEGIDLIEFEDKKQIIQKNISDTYRHCNELITKLNDIPKFAEKQVCPYTNEKCDKVKSTTSTKEEEDSLNKLINDDTNKIDNYNSDLELLDEQYIKVRDSYNDAKYSKRTYNDRLKTTENKMKEIEDKYSERDRIKNDYESLLIYYDVDDEDEDSLRTELNKFNETLSKLEDAKTKVIVNNKYNETYNSCSEDIAISNQNIIILSAWEKYSGANGIQNKIAEEPFLKLNKNLTKYLKSVFKKDVKGYFKIENKSNSFEFGIVRGDKTISFASLSSGEKCMYMIALLTCIVVSSKNDFKFICVDDSFDNLDDDHLKYVLDFCKSIKDVQYLFAGVRCIDDKDISIEIK